MYNKERKTGEMSNIYAELYKNSLAFANFSTDSQMGFRNAIAFCLRPLLEICLCIFFGQKKALGKVSDWIE